MDNLPVVRGGISWAQADIERALNPMLMVRFRNPRITDMLF